MTIEQRFETDVRAKLAEFGVTNLTFDWQGPSCTDGAPMVAVLSPDTDRIDVAEMIADDILKPLFFDIGGYGAGETFVHAAVDWMGGCVFWGKVSNRGERARYHLSMARIAANMVNSTDPIAADGMLDLAYVRYDAEMDKFREEATPAQLAAFYGLVEEVE